MSPIIILASVAVHELDVPNMEAYYRKLQPALGRVEGFQGLSLWRNIGDRERHLVLYHYASIEAADTGLSALADGKLLAETAVVNKEPANVMRIIVLGQQGKAVQAVAPGQFLSLSVRVSDPGYGQELADELDRIFGELTLIPGFLGSVYGRSESLEEEVVGLVTWGTRQAFESSVPEGTLYEVKLYQRVL